jgi:hypothetical protein
MTKFGKSGKTGPSDFLFWTVLFWQFQSKAKEGAEVIKTGPSGLPNQSIQFFENTESE